MDMDLTEAMDEVRLSLIEGIIQETSTCNMGTFDLVFDFHVQVVKMFLAREEKLQEELKRLKSPN